MVAAFEGWNDAADAASGAVDHLIEEWDAELLIELDPEDYYDFQMHRPHVHTEEDDERLIVWPAPSIFTRGHDAVSATSCCCGRPNPISGGRHSAQP